MDPLPPTGPSLEAPIPAKADPSPARADSIGAIFRRLGPAGILAIVWAVTPALAGILLLMNMQPISDWLLAHRATGYVLYIAIFILSAGFGLLPTYSQALLAGYAFGLAAGIPAALAGFVGASLVGYVVARTVSRDRVEREIARNPRAQAVRDALIGRGFWSTLGVVALLRLPPNSPFALTNLVMSASGVGKRVFLIGTALGMLPRTAAAVFIGTTIQNWNDPNRPRWWIIAGIVLALVVLLIIAHIAKKALARLSPPPASPGA